jgi:hypothetical protein
MSYNLKLFNTWQITLPKTWRDRYDTKIFFAEETDRWLLIKPIINDDTVYYENKDWFGIYSESWIDPNIIISKIKKLQNG